MGRPAKHTSDDFIDAAIEIYATAGARGVTLAAVAEAVGATNGSIYHRFPSRPALLAAMWLRTSRRFEAGYLEQLGDPSIESAIRAATWVVDWLADNLAEAQVLQGGPRALGRAEWPKDARTDAERAGEIQAHAQRVVRDLTDRTTATPDQIAFVLLELPIAVVRRNLHQGRPPGARERELVRSMASLVLRQPDA